MSNLFQETKLLSNNAPKEAYSEDEQFKVKQNFTIKFDKEGNVNLDTTYDFIAVTTNMYDHIEKWTRNYSGKYSIQTQNEEETIIKITFESLNVSDEKYEGRNEKGELIKENPNAEFLFVEDKINKNHLFFDPEFSLFGSFWLFENDSYMHRINWQKIYADSANKFEAFNKLRKINFDLFKFLLLQNPEKNWNKLNNFVERYDPCIDIEKKFNLFYLYTKKENLIECIYEADSHFKQFKDLALEQEELSDEEIFELYLKIKKILKESKTDYWNCKDYLNKSDEFPEETLKLKEYYGYQDENLNRNVMRNGGGEITQALNVLSNGDRLIMYKKELEECKENGYDNYEEIVEMLLNDYIADANDFQLKLLGFKVPENHIEILKELGCVDMRTYLDYKTNDCDPYKTAANTKYKNLMKFQGDLPLNIFLFGVPCDTNFDEEGYKKSMDELKRYALESKNVKFEKDEDLIEAIAYISVNYVNNRDLEFWVKNKEMLKKESADINTKYEIGNLLKVSKLLFDNIGDIESTLRWLKMSYPSKF